MDIKELKAELQRAREYVAALELCCEMKGGIEVDAASNGHVASPPRRVHRKKQSTVAKHCTKWTDTEHETMRRLIADGKTKSQVAALMDRTPGSIDFQARKLGCQFRSD